MSEEPALALLRELEQADEAVAAVLAELDDLAAEAERARELGLELDAFLGALPGERERLAEAATAAGRDEAEAVAALAEAEAELAEAGEDDVRLAAARRFVVRARDRLAGAERRRREAEAAREELERRAAAAELAAEELAGAAAELAKHVRSRPRLAEEAGSDPGPEPARVAEWGSRARATLLVARGSLAAEREAVVRQANELGALVLGEPLTSASAAVVARRVAQALERG